MTTRPLRALGPDRALRAGFALRAGRSPCTRGTLGACVPLGPGAPVSPFGPWSAGAMSSRATWPVAVSSLLLKKATVAGALKAGASAQPKLEPGLVTQFLTCAVTSTAR